MIKGEMEIERYKINEIAHDLTPSSVDGDTQQMNSTIRAHHLEFLMRSALTLWLAGFGRQATYSACM
jgi:hypothetical protein